MAFKSWLEKDDAEQQLTFYSLESLPMTSNSTWALPNRKRDLDLSRNRLSSNCLPSKGPRELQNLYLDSNCLTAFPENLPPNLENLRLQNNKIENFPENHLPKLKTLWLFDNKIVHLPERINAPLEDLNLKNNPIESTPKEWASSLPELVLPRGLGPEDRPPNLPDALKRKQNRWSHRPDYPAIFRRQKTDITN